MPTRSPARLLLLALLALVLATAASCSSDAPEVEPEIGEPAVSVSTSSSTTTPETETTTTVPPAGAATPDAAAAALYQAFTAGDQAAAAVVAEPAAITAVFAATPGPYQPYRGCDTAEFDTSGCLYRDRSTNNTIQFDMTRRGDAWVVTGAFFSPG